MKIGCIPIRPLLYVLAAFGVLRSGAQFFCGHHVLKGVFPLADFAFNVFLIVAVARRDVRLLKWAQRMTLACAILSVIPFLVIPVLSASFIASGQLEKYDFNSSSFDPEYYGNMTSPDYRFVMGTVVGLTIEIGIMVIIGIEILKYTLLSRIWRNEHNLQDLMNLPNFQAP